MSSHSSCKQYSFTLIELLVVIAIIAILAGLLFPALIGAKTSSQSTACKNLMKQYAFATSCYVADWNNFLPDIQTYLMPETGFVKAFGRSTFAQDITRCPADASTERLGRLGRCQQGTEHVLVSIGGSGNTLSNSKSGRSTGVVADYAVHGDPRMKVPSKSITWTDYQATSDSMITGAFYPASRPDKSSSLGNIPFRHNRTINASYLDGHVGTVRIASRIKLENYGHDLAPGQTWTQPCNTQYPFGPRAANVSMLENGIAADNPDVSYD